MKASEIIKEYGVGKITAQNATADVKPGDEFKNVKKLGLAAEGKTSKRMALVALIAALASSPAHSDDPVKDAYDLSRQIYKARDLSQAGVEEEAKQELKNIMRAIQGHPNQSKILNIFKKMYKSDDQLDEVLKKVKGKWALVSKNDPNKVLQYYRGPKDKKPSDEWVKDVERRVHGHEYGSK